MTSATNAAPVRGGAQFADQFCDDDAIGEKALDEIVAQMQASKDRWAATPIPERLLILEELSKDLQAVAPRWVQACVEGKGIVAGSGREGEEWGAFMVLPRIVRLTHEVLSQVAASGGPKLPSPVSVRPDGQVVVQVFPASIFDRMLFFGQTAEIWLDPALNRDDLEAEHAAQFRSPQVGKVALVLGAGNFSPLGPSDVLHRIFAENQVVVYKSNPVVSYLDSMIAEGLRALIDRDLLRVVGGGAAVGAYLTNHEGIDEMHLTGSDKTHDAIVFGSGEEGKRRKSANEPVNTKPFSCELGNISPTIVVPGPWTSADLAFQGEHIASMLTFNAGFNCLTTRVIVQHQAWEHRQALLDSVEGTLSETPTRKAYYPGAESRHARFLEAHPDAFQAGQAKDGHLPWTLVKNVDPNTDDMCFSQEAFCSLFAETALEAESVADYLDRAVTFVNTRLWGSLTCTVLVHPASLKDPAVAAAVDRAVANLRYGTVGINVWGAIGYAWGTPSWGAFPGHSREDIQSGVGVVNNTFRLPRVQKTVLRTPFRQRPKPPVFISHKTVAEMFKQLTAFEQSPSMMALPGITWNAIRG